MAPRFSEYLLRQATRALAVLITNLLKSVAERWVTPAKWFTRSSRTLSSQRKTYMLDDNNIVPVTQMFKWA